MGTLSMSMSTRLAQHWLARGQAALQEGRRNEAIAALQQAVAADPTHIEALLWFAGLCQDPAESLRHLARVLTLDPTNEAAHEGIRWARRRLNEQNGLPASPRIPRFLDEPTPPAPLTPESATAASPAAANTPYAERSLSRRPQRNAAAPSAFPALRKLTPLVIALWATIIVLLSGGLTWLILQPSINSRIAPIIAYIPEPSSATAPLPDSATQVDSSALYAERAGQTLLEANKAWTLRDWDHAAPLYAQALAFHPGDPTLRQKLSAAYVNRAGVLKDEGELDSALQSYDQALAVTPSDAQVRANREKLSNYLSALDQFNQRNWNSAAQSLAKVYAVDPGYLDTRALLFRSEYNQGVALKAAKDMAGALKAFQSAADLDNTDTDARDALAAVKAAMTRAVPAAAPVSAPAPAVNVISASGAKWIDVNLTTQRFRAMRGDSVVYSFATSTGTAGSPTVPGHFRILDKIRNPYSFLWNLQLPYWMGIYWVGSVENGIHALPIARNGKTIWGDLLGQPASFGCVVLDTGTAKLMYNWADIGTSVVIHY